MVNGGGTEFIAFDGDYPLPSSSGVFFNNDLYYFSFSYVTNDDSKLGVCTLTFDDNGWPVLGEQSIEFSFPHITDSSDNSYLTVSGEILEGNMIEISLLVAFLMYCLTIVF